MIETADVWRVWVKAWLHEFTGSEEECIAEFGARFAGRVVDGDWRVIRPFEASRGWWLEVRRWTVAGEFKHHDAAVLHAEGLDGETVVVGRGSRDEIGLRDYGLRLLA